jgi:hypothetical protein
MMRLVFLLSAEERGLLLLGDERYEANYALSTCACSCAPSPRKFSNAAGMPGRACWRSSAPYSAASSTRTCACRALGGSLFDPDRFPFLEGRAKGSNWRTDAAKPLPIDNRTVLLLLEAIQQFQGRTLSYRALDVEQIGYVYEGLLERTVKRTAKSRWNWMPPRAPSPPGSSLAELESPDWMVPHARRVCSRSAPAVPPVGCATIWPSPSTTPWPTAC